MSSLASQPEAGRSGISRAWIMVAVLTGCYLVSSLDRYAIGLLIQPIAHSLGLSDVQISLLIGIAFTLFYGTAGIALGGLVDRYDRRLIIVVGVVIWTAATVATGLAYDYVSLLLARIVVGAGEAALAPCAYSLIAESFPRSRLSRPTTVYFLGGAIGPGFSLIMGGFALHWAENLAHAGKLNWLHGEPWRLVMILAASPGLVAAGFVLWLIQDPRTKVVRQKGSSMISLWRELRAKPRLYAGLLTGTVAVSIYINGLATWWATFALRTFGWPLKVGGVYFGTSLAIGALAGIIASGSIGATLLRRFGDPGNGLALTALALAGSLLFIGAPLVAAPNAQLICITVALAFAFAINGLAPVGCQLSAEPAVRGRVSALYVAMTTIIGAGFGPATVAALETVDMGYGAIGLRGALSLTGFACSVVMVAAYYIYWRTQRRLSPHLPDTQ